MAYRSEWLELVPHYIAMVFIVLFVMTLIRSAVGEQHILVEFALILVFVFAYRPIIVRLDIVPTPALWEPAETEVTAEDSQTTVEE